MHSQTNKTIFRLSQFSRTCNTEKKVILFCFLNDSISEDNPVTLSAKSSLILGENKAAFGRDRSNPEYYSGFLLVSLNLQIEN